MSGGADRAIQVSTAAAVLGVAGIAAYVSYQHAFEVVRAHGESGLTARLEPATIDGLVYSSSMVVLYAARHRLPVPALARWLLALGIVATLAATVAKSACACSSETPGFRRPNAASPRDPRELSAQRFADANGVHISTFPRRPGSIHSGIASGITATIV